MDLSGILYKNETVEISNINFDNALLGDFSSAVNKILDLPSISDLIGESKVRFNKNNSFRNRPTSN